MKYLRKLTRYMVKRSQRWLEAGRLWASRYLGSDDHLVDLYHAPASFCRRSGDFTANICGKLAPAVKRARYRVNAGTWHDIRNIEPRVPHPLFTIELSHDELREGTNQVDVELSTYRGATRRMPLAFSYDAGTVGVPTIVDWTDEELDIQDGRWERFQTGGKWYVRPFPGEERYDRIIVAAGAFTGGRQIEAELIFRRHKTPGRPFGFGVLPMWGGRPDSAGGSPRGGWNFSLVWYYSKYEAVGMEFSYKDGDMPPAWTASYRSYQIEANARYRIKIQSWPKQDSRGKHLCHVQRMKWWLDGQPEPQDWMVLADTEGAPIPPGEYGVALIAHQSQVEFGPLTIEPFEPPAHQGGDTRT